METGAPPRRPTSTTVWHLASGAALVAGVVTIADAILDPVGRSTIIGLSRTAEAEAGWIITIGAALSLVPTARRRRIASITCVALGAGALGLLTLRANAGPALVALFGVLVALAAFASHSRRWSGTWLAGLTAALAIGGPLLTLSQPQDLPTSLSDAALPHGTPRGMALAFLTLGIAYLARAWSQGRHWALRAPTWLGTASTSLLVFVSVAFWHGLSAIEWETMMDQAHIREQAIGQLLRNDLAGRVSELERMARRIGELSASGNSRWMDEVDAYQVDLPSLQSVEVVDSDLTVLSAYPRTADLESLTTLLQTDDDRVRTARTALTMARSESISPVDLLGGGSALLLCVPVESEGRFRIVQFTLDLSDFVERRLGSLDNGFAIEVFNRDRLVFERGGLVGPDLSTLGTRAVAENSLWTLKAEPLPEWIDTTTTMLPDLVLVVSLIGSVLVGSTIYFAQGSALKAAASDRAHSQLRHLLDAASNVAIVATDTHGVITVFNDGAEHLTGFGADEVVGIRSPDAFVEVEQLWRAEEGSALRNRPAERFGALLARVGDAGLSDWTWVRRDGERRRVSMSATAWQTGSGERLGYLFIAVDVTERELAMTQLAQAKRQAESANNAKSAFLANISHEIRTPMAAILGYSDLMVDAATSTEERQEFAETIRRNGEHLLGIINDLLDLSKIEAGRMQVERIAVQPHEVLEEVVRMMRGRAQAKRLSLQYAPSEDPRAHALVLTDPLRLRQILVNLIGNAIKFTDQGWVQTSMRFQESPGKLRVYFDIADSGVGLREGEAQRLFMAFSQADTSTSRRFGGTGLGLAISKRLAELLGGSISVQSRLNEGSTFTLDIEAEVVESADFESIAESPTAGALAVSVTASSDLLGGTGGSHGGAGGGGTGGGAGGGGDSDSASGDLRGISVLIVEDGTDNRELLTRIMARAGATATAAHDGREAIDQVVRAGASGRFFDVIMMDMQMPEMDGYLATRRLRAIGYRGRIVALTGNSLEGDRDRCMEAGCDAHAVKPATRDLLIKLCRVEGGATTGSIPPHQRAGERGQGLQTDHDSGPRGAQI